ncbi:MAG: glycosyltransferase [Cytophagales bacterium]
MTFLLSSYIILVVFFIFQWYSIPLYKPVFNLLIPDKISLLIAVKNESENIVSLLQSIEKQTLSKQYFEVIIINDFSTDGTVNIVNSYASTSKLDIVLVSNNVAGKKYAITKGIAKSKYHIIVATDADCVALPNWLETVAHFMKEKSAKLAFGPVVIENESEGFFSAMQQIEFASLIGSGAASWQAGMPNMCNGANIAYLKSAFYEVKGFEGNEDIASGDDEFLMHKVYAKYPKDVYFLKSAEALVATKPIKNLADFYKQRTRWASKWEHYADWKVKAVAFYIFAVNLLQFVSYFFLPISTFLILWVARIFTEYVFLSRILGFMRKKLHLQAFFLLVLIYPFYVVFFALAGRIKSFAK